MASRAVLSLKTRRVSFRVSPSRSGRQRGSSSRRAMQRRCLYRSDAWGRNGDGRAERHRHDALSCTAFTLLGYDLRFPQRTMETSVSTGLPAHASEVSAERGRRGQGVLPQLSLRDRGQSIPRHVAERLDTIGSWVPSPVGWRSITACGVVSGKRGELVRSQDREIELRTLLSLLWHSTAPAEHVAGLRTDWHLLHGVCSQYR